MTKWSTDEVLDVDHWRVAMELSWPVVARLVNKTHRNNRSARSCEARWQKAQKAREAQEGGAE